MRSFLAGILLLIWPAVVLGQARGQVESIGFNDYFRPGCWTPMLVHLTATTGASFTGILEVVQEDLDRDLVLFTRQVTVTGNAADGTPKDTRYWTYFIPQPSRGNDELNESLSTAELTAKIKVRLKSADGKPLVDLPITSTIHPVSLRGGGMGGKTLGQKIVVCVYDHSPPNLTEYLNATTSGLTEEVIPVAARDIGRSLPDSVIGYDAVDAIIWSDADPTKLAAEQVSAIEQFVRRGGRLVISQDTTTNQWQRNNVAFPLLMPVIVRGVEERDDGLRTLRELAKAPVPNPGVYVSPDDAWAKLHGPFRYASVEVKPGSTVVAWQKDATGKALVDQAGKGVPYAVRGPAGAGSVTWVAQDLSDRQVLGDRDSTYGWAYVWDAMFDWRNEPIYKRGRDAMKDAELQPYESGTTWELGRAVLKYMDLPSTSAALIGIAVLFFVVYWVAAGPGSYLVLLKKGRASLSWFTFAAIALGATGLTVGIVKLVLRGAPQMRHVSLVRVAPGEPTRVHSTLGLYIPRDGDQKIELTDTAPNRASYITAFNLHPAFNNADLDFPARQEYVVPVAKIVEEGREPLVPSAIHVPYRSTLKKFQAEWIGATPTGLTGGIDGTVKLASDYPLVTGALTNNTGHDLFRVYLVVNNPGIERGDTVVAEDLVLFVSYWPKGGRLSLTNEFQRSSNGGAKQININPSQRDVLADDSNPTAVKTFQGRIGRDDRRNFGGNWADFWYADGWRTSSYGDNREYEERDPIRPHAFPILSFYDRLPVSQNAPRREASGQSDRVDFLRRGLRDWDLSSAISGGQMAVIAISGTPDEPLPFPLDVQGDKIEGKGTVYYQFVLPVDRSAVLKDPAAKPPPPATQPVKAKAEG